MNKADNHRRCELIDKEIAETITSDERIELDRLQHNMLTHRQKVAPRELHQELESEAASGVAEKIVDAIIEDIGLRSQFEMLWDATNPPDREIIRTEWIEIVEKAMTE